jgi:hypothetical protein
VRRCRGLPQLSTAASSRSRSTRHEDHPADAHDPQREQRRH